jgi:hypothetical protein
MILQIYLKEGFTKTCLRYTCGEKKIESHIPLFWRQSGTRRGGST